MTSFLAVCGQLIDKMNRAARPYLTVLVATVFNLLCAWAVISEKLNIKDYITAIAPTNAMIIGFWFGEKAALKNPIENERDE